MNYFDQIPTELLHVIARDSEPAYKALILAYPRFARVITPGNRIAYMIYFGHNVRVNKNRIEWFRRDLLHRIDGPAVVYVIDFGELWYKDAKRDDGPTIDHDDIKEDDDDDYVAPSSLEKHNTGDEIWYKNGVKHRDNGPATTYEFGCKEWWQRGKLHREDGPAVKYGDYEDWRIDGWRHRIGGPAVIKESGEKKWYYSGLKHRDGFPAIIYKDGSDSWYRLGKLHRIGGPAETWGDGRFESWYRDGVLHRDDGPAEIGLYFDCWHRNGELYQCEPKQAHIDMFAYLHDRTLR